jgi:hypothetical protein
LLASVLHFYSGQPLQNLSGVDMIAREAPTDAERKVAVVDDEGREVGTVPVEDDKK